MEDGVIQAQAMAARIACARMTMLHLTVLHDSVELFRLLADGVDDPLPAGGAGYMREVMLAVGRPADGMIVSSRRLPAHQRACDREADALEVGRHLRVLLYTRRLALPGGQPTAGETVT